MNKTFTTKTAAETQELANALLLDILNKRIVLLSGQLGSGKTSFVKGLAKALGITQVIKSPTYTYVNTYKIRRDALQCVSTVQTRLIASLHHFDLYRLPDPKNPNNPKTPNYPSPDHTAASIGLTEALHDSHALVIIEWPERLAIFEGGLRISFEKTAECHLISVMTGQSQ